MAHPLTASMQCVDEPDVERQPILNFFGRITLSELLLHFWDVHTDCGKAYSGPHKYCFNSCIAPKKGIISQYSNYQTNLLINADIKEEFHHWKEGNFLKHLQHVTYVLVMCSYFQNWCLKARENWGKMCRFPNLSIGKFPSNQNALHVVPARPLPDPIYSNKTKMKGGTFWQFNEK